MDAKMDAKMNAKMRTGQDGWNAWMVGMLLAAGVAALCIVLLSGCGASGLAAPTASQPVTRRVVPTTTAARNEDAAHWQAATWPRGMNLDGMTTPPMVMSPADGNTDYMCTGAGGPQGNEQVWVTHNFAAPDAGAVWTRLHDLPVAQQDINTCTVVVDTTDPATLVVMAASSISQFAEVSYASFDGGQTWQALSQQPVLFTGPLATYQGKIYGIVAFSYVQEYVNPNPAALRVSSDQMRTWQPVNGGDQFDAFWLNPGSGELLAHQFKSRQFVTSGDGGQTWHAFANPSPFDTLSNTDVVAVQAPKAGQPWMICGITAATAATSSQPATHADVCTRDLGQTYITLPTLPDTPAGTRDPAGAIWFIGITGDGTVLAMLSIDVVPQGPKGSGAVTSLGFRLWRLPPGATQWQSLDVPPQFYLSYAPGALFAWPANGISMPTCATCGGDPLSSYVAAYP